MLGGGGLIKYILAIHISKGYLVTYIRANLSVTGRTRNGAAPLLNHINVHEKRKQERLRKNPGYKGAKMESVIETRRGKCNRA
jgi:hypothetical protein